MKLIMEKPLVSIFTPCYNTGNLVGHLLDSLLMQDYPNVELFVIDDGSTDNTKDVVNSYSKAFTDKGYSFHYMYQENSGQSVATDNGLKHVSGKYLLWPDSDDYYIRPDAITLMVEEMEKNINYPLMRAFGNLVDEDTGKIIKVYGADHIKKEGDSDFEDCIFSRNGFYFQPICYILRLSSLRNSTQFPIYTSKNAGQNWQIMLPVLYNQQLGVIPQVLCNILNRKQSHSRIVRQSFEKEIMIKRTYCDTVVGTLNRIIGMDDVTKNNYIYQVKELFLRKELEIDYRYNLYTSFLDNYAIYKEQYPDMVTTKMRIWHVMMLTRTKKLMKKIQMLIFPKSNN